MTTLLVLTGPQGSGNHLFSKIFAEHPAVNGWKDLTKTYWIGHDQEPFVKLWQNPALVKEYNWDSHEYHVTSISCPYMNNGQAAYPNYSGFLSAVADCRITIELAVIGRDQNILAYQEQRLRDRITYTEFLEQLPNLMQYNPVFLSQELVYLYKEQYLRQISKQLDFPIQFNPNVLATDANAKYLQAIESNWLDQHIKLASSKHS
jgi:hypothetical protein